jgi:hypothetical protein
MALILPTDIPIATAEPAFLARLGHVQEISGIRVRKEIGDKLSVEASSERII